MLTLALALSVSDARADDAHTQAAGTEVGTSKTVGIGFLLGQPNLFTAKFWLDEQSAVSVAAGAYTNNLDRLLVRVQYGRTFYTIGDWDWGILDLYWNVGAGTNLDLSGTVWQPGAGGGVSAMIRFKDAPAEVFVDNSIYLYPGLFSAAFESGYVGGIGGRWYF